MPLKKATRSKATATSKKTTPAARSRSKKSKTPSWSVGAGTMLVAAICVTGAVIVIAARELTPAPRTVSVDTTSEPVAAPESVKVNPSAAAASESVMAKAPETDTPEVKGTVGRTAPVTVFGCLRRSDAAFRLTDTDGVDAPKSRSWKTGFLKKGSASIEVSDPGNRLRLASHVGQRLSVTGTLVDRQMQVRSIRRISASCD